MFALEQIILEYNSRTDNLSSSSSSSSALYTPPGAAKGVTEFMFGIINFQTYLINMSLNCENSQWFLFSTEAKRNNH